MKAKQRRQVLRSACSLLPPERARQILARSPDDYGTYVQAYLETRLLGTLPAGLKRALLVAIFELMDAETAQTLRDRTSGISDDR